MTWGEVLVTLLGAAILVVGTWITARFSRKTGEEANENAASQARTADWSAFMAEQREWVEDMLAERDKRIDRLEKRLDTIEQKYRHAVAYIRRLVAQLHAHIPPDRVEKPPAEILPDL